MNNVLEIDVFGKQLNTNITVDSENFGKVIFYYKIINIKTNKFLRYKIGDHSEIYMVDYNIIEQNLTLHEYFRNCLKYLYLQLQQLKKDYELRDLMKPNEKELITYIENLEQNFLKK